ncbi:restriction endonuclease subunit S [Pseudomonas putida]|uniref:Type I restriction modification DNA specificity domain-containing protein n=1 Tax=Pseudomonas putida TaxID=303 RepID=A0A1X1A075_PSEPU|nr:restriction endonuclease subunit S [Pseudomonas putida]ORL65267.1 hypothetical protein B7H17_08870 [Pseudomonas putida]
MNSEWRTASLLDHYEVRSGLSKPAKDFGSGYPFLTFKDVFYNYFTPEHLGDFVQATEREREGCSILRGDVFLTRTSETMHELGMSCVALRSYKDATFNGFCKRLRPKPSSELLPEYVGYYLRSPVFRRAVSAMSTMSTRASLNNEMIGRLEISFPPREVQVRISEILKSLDDRITLLRETNATLEAIAQALFKSWFVDFDPVRAKAEGRQPEGVDVTTAALFPDSFEESELGLVPKGWLVGFLSDVCTIASGKRPPDRSDHLTEVCSIPLYGGAGLMGYTSASLFDEMQIVTGRVGTLGKVHVAYPPFWASDNVLVVSPKEPADFTFALHWIRSVDVQALNRGSTQPLLTQRDLGAQQGLIPTRELLRKFQEIAGPLYEQIRLQELQAQTLTQLRDTLLPRLISGQLGLPEAEALIEEAV